MSFEDDNKSEIGSRSVERVMGMAGAAITAAAGTGWVGPTQEADAAIVVHTINQVVPATTAGLYVNLFTGATGSTPTAVGAGPWMNPWGSSTATLSWWAPVNGGNWRGVNIGSQPSDVSALPLGFVVSSAIPNSGAAGTPRFNAVGGTSRATGNPGDFTLNALNHFGFRFEVGTATHYGWGSMDIGADMSIRTLRQVAFEDLAGTGIAVGALVAVPEPSSLALLAGGSIGVAAWRARRKPKAESVA